MESYKYIILGAGPSGLSFAHTLIDLGEKSFLIIERESEPGGLCRSEQVDGSPLDLGGGHFLDVERKDVLALLFRFMPRSEWNEYSRVSTIRIRNTEIDYPLEANLWQLPLADQVEFLASIAQAGCVQGSPMPSSFDEWISWKLGKLIAEEYMLPYNRKIWSMDLNELGTYWLHKLPDVSFKETLQGALQRKSSGKLPAHRTFLYPRSLGFGEVWRRMGAALNENLLLDTPVRSVDIDNRVVNSTFKADFIINTIPWTAWRDLADFPDSVKSQIDTLRFSSIDVDYHSADCPTRAHWVYDPDESLAHHRVLCRANYAPASRGFWTETNSKRARPRTGWRHRNEYAYPLNTIDKPAAIQLICNWARERQIVGLGRWGTWEHMNSDVAVSQAVNLATSMIRLT